ncbi:Amidophosphoribosyltransferase [Serratia grimesii]|nr:Amidophosphoribosyltransferase [Serratia grimesii]
MCGIVGIAGFMPVNQSIYDALTVLQHRGQDAAGIVTIDAHNGFRLRKANGLVKDVFEARHMQRLQGNMGIGHVRYPTAGSSSASEAQPFYVNSPFGITLAHNGNLTNAHELRQKLFESGRRHINTTSDSEILLNVLASELDRFQHYPLESDNIFTAVAAMHQQLRGAYACVAMIIGHGLLAFRDPHGIRPLVIGKRQLEDGRNEYMVASESVALDTLGFEFLRDVAPGEAVYITNKGQLFTRQCAENPKTNPCLFEYVYFARPDSFMDKISVYSARVRMGQKLGEKIAREWEDLDIDVVIPIPETSCDIALEIARILDKPYRQGFVKNRYVGRTFIMPGQQARRQSVRRKLNANRAEFRDKNVLLVDDSIVRGTTSEQIVEMARDAGAKRVYLASAAPEVRFPNVYGIDMPSANELIAHGREVDEIRQIIGADGLIFQDLDDLIEAVREENPDIAQFECSVFNGIYVTKDVDQSYPSPLRQSLPDPIFFVAEASFMKRLIIGISGASGAIYGVRLLQVLRDVAEVETHLVMSNAARQTLSLETTLSLREVQALADVVHDSRDIGASISSGSFKTAGMVILPCSIKTLSGIANSYSDGLLTRAADVVLKERRRLVLCVRETPLHIGHLRLMTQAAEMGAVIMPPVPAFYHRPESVEDIIDQTVNRVVDQFDIELPKDLFTRWQGAN